MNRAALLAQLESLAAQFTLFGPARVVFPADKYEALRSLAQSSDDFSTKLDVVEGRYIERVTVNIVVAGVTFCATKVQPTVMCEVTT